MGTMNEDQKNKMAATRIMNALYRNGINSLYDLHNTSLEDIAKFHHIGKNSMTIIANIKSVLEQHPEMCKNPNEAELYTGDKLSIEFSTKDDCREFFKQLNEILDREGKVSIVDMLQVVGMEASYNQRKYGWTSLAGFHMFRMPSTNDWCIHIPDPIKLVNEN